MQSTRIQLTILSCLLVSPLAVAEPLDSAATNFARVAWHQVAAPFGKFLLIKGDQGICAIRFTEYHSKPPTIFSSGKESYFAAYEWFYQNDGSGNFTNEHVKHDKGRVRTGTSKGIHPIVFGTGNHILRCGPYKTYWLKPSSVSFSRKISCQPKAYELSPTKWQDVSKIDISDSRLRWFRCDENRKSFRIPIEEL